MATAFKFCPHCGAMLVPRTVGGRDRAACTNCTWIHFQNPAVGVAVIVLEQGKVLLGRRRGSYAGDWCIPCGYVEWDEPVREAACREFLEETGLQVEIGAPFEVHSNFHNPAQHTVGVWFLGKVTGGELAAGDDLSDVAFFDLNALPENLCFPTDQMVLQRIARELTH